MRLLVVVREEGCEEFEGGGAWVIMGSGIACEEALAGVGWVRGRWCVKALRLTVGSISWGRLSGVALFYGVGCD
jgi:hypothetical protein